MITGIGYCGRQEWERTRTAAYISIAPHCKKIDKEKLLPFPWDVDKKETYISSDDIKRVKKLSSQFENVFKK